MNTRFIPLAEAAAELNNEIDSATWTRCFEQAPDASIEQGMWIDHSEAAEADDQASAKLDLLNREP